MTSVGHTPGVGDKRNAYRMLARNIKRGEHLEDLRVLESIRMEFKQIHRGKKMDLGEREWKTVDWIDLAQSTAR
jgi:hypothetical protein